MAVFPLLHYVYAWPVRNLLFHMSGKYATLVHKFRDKTKKPPNPVYGWRSNRNPSLV